MVFPEKMMKVIIKYEVERVAACVLRDTENDSVSDRLSCHGAGMSLIDCNSQKIPFMGSSARITSRCFPELR